MQCEQIMAWLEELSPKQYACDWDNVGLLVGRKGKEIKKIMIALDASKDVIRQAIEQQVDLLITHHPMIFSAIKQVTEQQFTQEKVLELAENGIAYYAMHTNYDAVGGMAELAAGPEYLNLSEVSPIADCGGTGEGMGRYGKLPKPMTAKEVAGYVKERFELSFVMLYQSPGDSNRLYEKIAVMPGSGKSEMRQVKENGYDLYLTGDYGHHEGLDAMDMGMTVIDATHYGLEHIFMKHIKEYLEEKISHSQVEIVLADCGSPVEIL